jgi:hypothetical protein
MESPNTSRNGIAEEDGEQQREKGACMVLGHAEPLLEARVELVAEEVPDADERN